MKMSDQVAEIFAALAKAQGEFPQIPKDKEVVKRGTSKKTGKEYEITYRFSSFEQIIEIVKPILSKNGLGFFQDINKELKICTTRICHSSGQWYETEFPVVLGIGDMQEYGKDSTYGKRYGLTMSLGLSSDEDLDGNSSDDEFSVSNRPNKANQPPKTPAKPKNHAPQPVPPIKQLTAMVSKLKLTNEQATEAIKRATGKESSKDLTDDEIFTVIKYLGMKK